MFLYSFYQSRFDCQEKTIRKHMSEFFLSVGGLGGFFCFLVMVFCILSGSQYQNALNQLTRFNEYTAASNEAVNNLNYFLQTENADYYEQCMENCQLATDYLNTLYENTKNDLIRREFADLKDINQNMQNKINSTYKEMISYFAGDSSAYQSSSEEYSHVLFLETALKERYQSLYQLMLSDIITVYRSLNRNQYYFIFCFVFLLTITVVTIFRQMKSIRECVTKPLQYLTKSADEIQALDLMKETITPLEILAPVDQDIRTLMVAFNKMIAQIQLQLTTFQENTRIRQELSESRFLQLQMQINPHFLFNTLNMIAEKAYLENADETRELLENAATMFRYSLDFTGKAVTLGKELEELCAYVYIQEERYGDQIQFKFELDESLNNVPLPALTLQPLVENSIVHGVGCKRGKSEIRIITSSPEEGVGLIQIQDNGEGMSEQKLAEVQNLIDSYNGESIKIGLGNVSMRLKMFFNGQAKIKVISQEHKGTNVTIIFPL